VVPAYSMGTIVEITKEIRGEEEEQE